MNNRAVHIDLTRLRHYLAAAMLAVAVCSVGPARAAEETPAPEMASEATLSPKQPIVTVNGKAITYGEIEAHAEAIMRPFDTALEDLIDLQLLSTAATAQKVKLPPAPWSPETRTGLEVAVAQALGIEAAKPRTVLIVDHAWLKDAENEKERTAGRALIDKMRALVVTGTTIPQAFTRMNLDGNLWHIGDHEEYPAEVLPPEARDLALGSISPVIPGDGGLHLFRIYESRQQVGDQETIGAILRSQLREGATIERP